MADDNDIYKMTGCLSSCQKSTFEIELSQQNENSLDDSKDSALQLTTIVPLSRYELREQVFSLNFDKILQNLTQFDFNFAQYLVYDWNSFIADVGGYLGLMLGQSIYGIYEILTKCVMDKAAKCILPQ